MIKDNKSPKKDKPVEAVTNLGSKPDSKSVKVDKDTVSDKSINGSTATLKPSTRIPDSEFMKGAADTGKVDFSKFNEAPNGPIDVGKSIAKLAEAALNESTNVRVRPQMPNPNVGQTQSAPAVQPQPTTPNAVIFQNYPQMFEVDKILSENGKYFVVYTWSNGLLKADVRLAEKLDESINTKSITFDLVGLIVTPWAKWWPGVKHDRPVDMLQSYKFDLKEIKNYFDGGITKVSKEAIAFDQKVGYLNKVVDLRSIMAIKDIDADTAQHMFTKISKAVTSNAMSKQIKKECKGKRFVIGSMTDKDNFTLVTSVLSYMSSVEGSYDNMRMGQPSLPVIDDVVFSLVFESGKPARLTK